MAKEKQIDFDDFPLSPTGSLDAADFYASFLECKKLLEGVPKKALGQDTEQAFYRLLQDVHSTKGAKAGLFRKKSDASAPLVMLWLSRVRTIANVFLRLNKVPAFRGLTPDRLSHLAKLSRNPNRLGNVAAELFAEGILVIYERAIPSMKLDGAAFLLNGNPVIALSLRYPRLDIYWFTLMHELAHVVLHRDVLEVPILDDLDEESDDVREKEADRLASNSLISRSDWRSCAARYSASEKSVRDFASTLGIHPSIVAGRLGRELDRHDLFSKIINEVNVREVLLGDG